MADRYWVAGGTGNYNSTTNWSATSGGASGASFPDVSDNIFFNASSGVGTATINVASQCANLNLTGFLGTLAFTNSLTVNGLILNFGLGTYTVTGTGFLIYALANNTFSITSNGTIWTGNLRIGNLQPTITFVDNFSITGNLELRSAGVTTFNGSTLFVGGSLAFLTGGFIQGTTNIVFNGTGTWSHTFSTGYLRNNITINTAGTLTLGANIGYGTSTLTYTAGTVVTTGSTLNIATNTTLNTNGITWNNITANGSTAITLGSNLTLIGTLTITNGTLSFVLGGFSLISINANLTLGVASSTFTMPANQTFKTLTITGATTSVNANTLTITENLIINNPVSGTTAIIYAGTGTWSASYSLAIINNIFTINTAGTLTISGIVYKATGLFTYIAGTIIDTGATVIISGPTTLNISGKTWNKLLVNNIITLSSNINATTFGTTGANATSFVLGGNTLNFTNLELGNSATTTLPTAWVCQNITFINTAIATINGNSITINGDINQNGGSNYLGTTTFTYAGTGTWTAPSLSSYFTSSFTINTAGTLTIISANIGGGIFTYTAGTVITTGSTLNIRQSGTTMNDGIIIWYNVVSPTNVTSLILNNQLVCSNALTIDDSQVTFSGADGTFDVYYLNLNSQGIIARTPKLVSLKTYRVRAGFTSQGTLAFPITLQSTVAASQAIFTVDPGATINVGFVNTKDINSSLGRPIYSYKGVFINTLNWNLLPTDVTPKVNTFAN
jgi:hypothetical protein